jgi:hypothetical protein
MTALKAWVAAAAAVLAWVLPAILPGMSPPTWGVAEVANVVVLAAAALHVYNTANTEGWRWAKAIAAGIAAAAVVLISAWSDQLLTAAEIVQMAIAVLAAVGVGFARNAGSVDGVITSGRHALRP